MEWPAHQQRSFAHLQPYLFVVDVKEGHYVVAVVG